jgi:phosphoribosylanthranilate isomerase
MPKGRRLWVRTKICGIRSEADLAIAVDVGANAVGFLVGLTHRSEDKLDAVDARRLIRSVPPFVQGVMVTHLASPQDIVDLAMFLGASTIQLHGEMVVDAIHAVRRLAPSVSLIRAVHVTGGTSAEDLITHVKIVSHSVDGILLDSRTVDRLGGTGQTHDWSVSQRVVAASPLPVILAGGLTPDNVADAVRTTRPYAVDVNSGVETATGDKSPDLCASFVINAQVN